MQELRFCLRKQIDICFVHRPLAVVERVLINLPKLSNIVNSPQQFEWIQFADILPIYHLGNSQLLTYCGSEWLSRKARTTIGMFWGWRGLPIPYPHDIITCVGFPIKGKDSHQHSSSSEQYFLLCWLLLLAGKIQKSRQICNNSGCQHAQLETMTWIQCKDLLGYALKSPYMARYSWKCQICLSEWYSIPMESYLCMCSDVSDYILSSTFRSFLLCLMRVSKLKQLLSMHLPLVCEDFMACWLKSGICLQCSRVIIHQMTKFWRSKKSYWKPYRSYMTSTNTSLAGRTGVCRSYELYTAQQMQIPTAILLTYKRSSVDKARSRKSYCSYTLQAQHRVQHTKFCSDIYLL